MAQYKIPYYATPVCFFILGIILISVTSCFPINDFGNYYYGSKCLVDGLFTEEIYTSIGYFNSQVSNYGETNFFLNYIPVPPFSAFFYAPFTFLNAALAKLTFNSISLIVFCWSLKRLITHYHIQSVFILALPFVFAFPFYHNITQGQSYLLLLAMLSESLLTSEQNKIVLPSILIAICGALKLFPIFMLVYFIKQKQYRVVVLSLLSFIALNIVTACIIHHSIVLYYFTDVIPRLINNDVVGAYHFVNQSIYTFLLNVFTYDALNNTRPLCHLPFLVPVLETIFISIFLGVLFSIHNSFYKLHSLFIFGFTLLVMILTGRYNPSYALIFLIPFALGCIKMFGNSKFTYYYIILLTVACWLPLINTGVAPKEFLFLRLALLITVFILILVTHYKEFNIKYSLLFLVLIGVIKCVGFSSHTINYFPLQNTKGVLTNMVLKQGSICFNSCLGSKNKQECYLIKGNIKLEKELFVQNNTIVYYGKAITNTSDNKLQPFIYNDTSIVFMSDLNQALRFYKLRCISLNKNQ